MYVSERNTIRAATINLEQKKAETGTLTPERTNMVGNDSSGCDDDDGEFRSQTLKGQFIYFEVTEQWVSRFVIRNMEVVHLAPNKKVVCGNNFNLAFRLIVGVPHTVDILKKLLKSHLFVQHQFVFDSLSVIQPFFFPQFCLSNIKSYLHWTYL